MKFIRKLEILALNALGHLTRPVKEKAGNRPGAFAKGPAENKAIVEVDGEIEKLYDLYSNPMMQPPRKQAQIQHPCRMIPNFPGRYVG